MGNNFREQSFLSILERESRERKCVCVCVFLKMKEKEGRKEGTKGKERKKREWDGKVPGFPCDVTPLVLLYVV